MFIVERNQLFFPKVFWGIWFWTFFLSKIKKGNDFLEKTIALQHN